MHNTLKAAMRRGSGIALALLFVSAGAQAREEHVITKKETIPSNGISTIHVQNLAGTVDIVRSDSQDIVIEARFVGGGRNLDDAKQNAELLSLKVAREGDRLLVDTLYPVDEHRVFRYEGTSRGHSRSNTKYMGERVTVSSRDGLPVHADYTIALPDGMSFYMLNLMGPMKTTDVNADLSLDIASGSVDMNGGKGKSFVDSGSGSVVIRQREGDVLVDTGSGSTDILQIVGNVVVDSGSGSVTLEHITGDVTVDSGSGGVEMDTIAGNLEIDTGSGRVAGTNMSKTETIEIDTGSGGVRLAGDLSDLRRLMIDTGSGGVRLQTSRNLNMELVVDAGSGGVDVDLPDMRDVQKDRNDLRATIGEGEGRGRIDTGSGGVEIELR